MSALLFHAPGAYRVPLDAPLRLATLVFFFKLGVLLLFLRMFLLLLLEVGLTLGLPLGEDGADERTTALTWFLILVSSRAP